MQEYVDHVDYVDYFEDALMTPQLIESKRSEVRRLRYLASSLSGVDTTGERVSSSRDIKCRYAELIDKAVDLENEILEDVNKMLDRQREMGRIIDSLPNPIWKLIMRDLYIDGLSVKKTAKKRKCSEKSVYNYKKQVLSYLRLLSEGNAL